MDRDVTLLLAHPRIDISPLALSASVLWPSS